LGVEINFAAAGTDRSTTVVRVFLANPLTLSNARRPTRKTTSIFQPGQFDFSSPGGAFYWHTNCGSIFVAKKFHAPGMVRTAADSAALNLRMATMQLSGLRVPPRIRTVPTLRRRLPVTAISEPPQPVIIRHVRQNLGSSVSETRPIQSPRV
jgi:hypothetical protein